MTVRNVLILPAGTEIGLEIFHALKDCKEVRLFGAGADRNNHAPMLYEYYDIVPALTEPNWLSSLMSVCACWPIDYIIPAYDDMIVALARHQKHLPPVITSPLYACEVTRSKSATYKALDGLVRVPKTFSIDARCLPYPVFVKPDRGQGSAGAFIAHDHIALRFSCQEVGSGDSIICEYLPGTEYTVDCFSDREHGLLFCGPRIRNRMRNGISMNTDTMVDPKTHQDCRHMADVIGEHFGMHGTWFFQVKRAAGGELCLLEVAPRISGSMAANRVLGVNFPLMSIYEHERRPLTALVHRHPVALDRALCNRYRHQIRFSRLYVDLDDTLIVRGKVNLAIMKLIFQCINDCKPVTLLTRHADELAATLAKHRLHGLFDNIQWIRDGVSKAEFIREPDAILVDDSFAERSAVSAARGILTFDCSMIEVLTEGTYRL